MQRLVNSFSGADMGSGGFQVISQTSRSMMAAAVFTRQPAVYFSAYLAALCADEASRRHSGDEADAG